MVLAILMTVKFIPKHVDFEDRAVCLSVSFKLLPDLIPFISLDHVEDRPHDRLFLLVNAHPSELMRDTNADYMGFKIVGHMRHILAIVS